MTTESIKNIKKISSQVCTRVVKQSRRVSLTQINICVHTKATPSSIIKVNLNETAWLSGAVKFYGTGWSGVEWSGRRYESSRHPFNIPHAHNRICSSPARK